MRETAKRVKEQAPEGSMIYTMPLEEVERLLLLSQWMRERKEKARLYATRIRIHNTILIKRAKEQGITVTKQEIEKEMGDG